MSVMLYPCMLCVALVMCLFVLCVACLTVFVNCLVKQFAMCLSVVDILLLNVMEVCVVVLCWIDHVWSSKECVCCVCDPNERQVLLTCFVCVFVLVLTSPGFMSSNASIAVIFPLCLRYRNLIILIGIFEIICRKTLYIGHV